jgi:S1-C subfamily serine protease
MPRLLSCVLAAAMLLCLLVAPAALADYVKMKDGTVLEGTVLQQPYGYWVKTADGKIHKLQSADVASMGKGAAPAAGAPAPAPGSAPKVRVPGAAPAVPSPAAAPSAAASNAPRSANFSATRAKCAAVESALAAVTHWQAYVDAAKAGDPDLPAAKEELAKWKKLADGGAEKIKGKWVGGDERKAILDKARALTTDAEAMMKANQTLQAVKKLEEAAGIYPNSFETNFTLGWIAMNQHNEEKAIEWFNKALLIQPENPEAMTNLGVVWVTKRQYEKGITLMRKALEKRDRKEIVHNLITAISYLPPPMRKNKEIKAAEEAALLLAGRYGISGPSNHFLIVAPDLREKKEGRAGPGKAGDDDDSSNPAGMWNGTGFIVSADGLILTNRHVVEGGKTLLVMLNPAAAGGESAQKSAEVVVIDTDQDLALIRIKPDAGKKFPFVLLTAADTPADGAECTVMGYPLIDRLGANVKVTRGIVSSSAKQSIGPDVVLDAKVNPGNSGGPILDRYGNVMAIVSMKTLASASEDTYGLGISAGQIRKFLTKNKVNLQPAVASGPGISAEEIAAKVKPATVCILGTK